MPAGHTLPVLNPDTSWAGTSTLQRHCTYTNRAGGNHNRHCPPHGLLLPSLALYFLHHTRSEEPRVTETLKPSSAPPLTQRQCHGMLAERCAGSKAHPPAACTPKDFSAALQSRALHSAEAGRNSHRRGTKPRGTQRVPGHPGPSLQAGQTAGGSQQSHCRRRKCAASRRKCPAPLDRGR